MNDRAHGSAIRDPRPLIVHVVYRFDVGGLENGVVNLINRLPVESYRHAVVSLTEITDFRRRVLRGDVTFVALNKGPGHLYRFFPRLYRLFRELAPAIVHTRNLAALEASVPAWMAGVPVRVHGEHGRDMGDLDGTNRKYQRVRRLYRPFVSQYVALSKDLEKYLSARLAVDPQSIDQIYNGVDTERFAPASGRRIGITGCPFSPDECWLVGTVGRLHEVKDQVTLAEAFVRAVRRSPAMAKMRLVVVGDGPLMARVERVLVAADMRDLAWLPGERNDVPEILRGLDCFVLPSLAEGISNTILEAMACGIPVVATRVGGNPELVEDGMTGKLVPQANAEAMATALLNYFEDPVLARRHGNAGRHAVLQLFSLDRMVADYHSLYATLIAGRTNRPERAGGNARSRQAMF